MGIVVACRIIEGGVDRYSCMCKGAGYMDTRTSTVNIRS